MVAYPSRYRIEERGRRLVTIDTRTGRVYGADTARDPAPVRREPVTVRTAAPAVSNSPTELRSALSAVNVTSAPDRTPPPPVSIKLKPGGGGKLIALAAGGLMLTVFLIMTNLWIVVVIALAIAPVRSAALTWGKAALKKSLDQAATG